MPRVAEVSTTETWYHYQPGIHGTFPKVPFGFHSRPDLSKPVEVHRLRISTRGAHAPIGVEFRDADADSPSQGSFWSEDARRILTTEPRPKCWGFALLPPPFGRFAGELPAPLPFSEEDGAHVVELDLGGRPVALNLTQDAVWIDLSLLYVEGRPDFRARLKLNEFSRSFLVSHAFDADDAGVEATKRDGFTAASKILDPRETAEDATLCYYQRVECLVVYETLDAEDKMRCPEEGEEESSPSPGCPVS